MYICLKNKAIFAPSLARLIFFPLLIFLWGEVWLFSLQYWSPNLEVLIQAQDLLLRIGTGEMKKQQLLAGFLASSHLIKHNRHFLGYTMTIVWYWKLYSSFLTWNFSQQPYFLVSTLQALVRYCFSGAIGWYNKHSLSVFPVRGNGHVVATHWESNEAAYFQVLSAKTGNGLSSFVAKDLTS